MTQDVVLKIVGRVQGVGFRAWTVNQAQSLSLSGWVRNAADGSVEVQLIGTSDAVEEMMDRLWSGPRYAHVSSVTPLDSAPKASHSPQGFIIIR